MLLRHALSTLCLSRFLQLLFFPFRLFQLLRQSLDSIIHRLINFLFLCCIHRLLPRCLLSRRCRRRRWSRARRRFCRRLWPHFRLCISCGCFNCRHLCSRILKSRRCGSSSSCGCSFSCSNSFGLGCLLLSAATHFGGSFESRFIFKMIAASILHLSHSTSKNTYILYTNSRAVAVNEGHASLHRAQRFGTRYRMCSRGTHRHVTGFVAAAVLLLLLVLPDFESDRD
jgi:hypothetical protein